MTRKLIHHTLSYNNYKYYNGTEELIPKILLRLLTERDHHGAYIRTEWTDDTDHIGQTKKPLYHVIMIETQKTTTLKHLS